MKKLKIGILGATGIVGQNYIRLLQNHPWFEIVDVAASPRSAGKPYYHAVSGKWQMPIQLPLDIRDLIVRDVNDLSAINENVSFVFSAVNLPVKEDLKKLEMNYAQNDIPVISNNSAHRWTPDVPMLIPEVNFNHIDVIPIQRRNRGFKRGFVVVKPNCAIQSYIAPIFALEQANYKVEKVIVTTLQGVSGAGYPGVPTLDMIDNIVPFIGNEEEKSEKEPHKVLGTVGADGIENDNSIEISATCTRVPVSNGHTASVNLKFKNQIPSKDEILKIWTKFRSVPQELDLPYAPKHPLVYLEEEDRPQPKRDRDKDKGMAVTLGRLRKDNVFDYKFIGLSHNTVRGAAGGGILNAELLYVKKYFD